MSHTLGNEIALFLARADQAVRDRVRGEVIRYHKAVCRDERTWRKCQKCRKAYQRGAAPEYPAGFVELSEFAAGPPELSTAA